MVPARREHRRAPGRRRWCPIGAHSLSLVVALMTPAAQAAVFQPGVDDADPPTGDAGPVAPRQAAEPLRAPGFRWVLAPWRSEGVVSLDGRWLNLGQGRTSQQGLLSTDFEWASHLWQPWFLQMRFGLGVLASRDASRGGADGDSSSGSGLGLTGRLALSLFPASRFPFELRADLGDNRSGGDSFAATSQLRRVSLSQSYRPERGNSSYHLHFDHSKLSADGSDDVLSSLQFTAQHQWGVHNLDAGAHVASNRRSDVDEHNRVASVNVRHGFHPRPELQVETLANWNETRQVSGAGGVLHSLGNEVTQLSTMLSWRPREGDWLYSPDRPLQVAASARWAEVAAVSEGPRTRAQAWAVTLGANLDLSPVWRLSGSVAGNQLRTGDTTAQSVNFSGTATWVPSGTDWGRWRYLPNGALNLGATQSSDAQWRGLVGVQASHGVSRDWAPAEDQRIALNLTQSAAVARESSSPAPVRGLAHSVGLFWQQTSQSGQQRSAGLSLSDSRSRVTGSGIFQMVNLQLSQRTQVSRLVGWSVNLTLQATHNQATEIDPFTGERRTQGGGWQRFYSGGASLEQQRLFGIPRLRHTLQFSLNSQQIEQRALGDIDAPRERISQSLESRIDYLIGRLDLRLSARHARVDGRAVTSLNARVQRRF